MPAAGGKKTPNQHYYPTLVVADAALLAPKSVLLPHPPPFLGMFSLRENRGHSRKWGGMARRSFRYVFPAGEAYALSKVGRYYPLPSLGMFSLRENRAYSRKWGGMAFRSPSPPL